jgi:exodeoxyribonuclease VII small subunit
LKFEEAMKRMEEVVKELEDGELTLDKSLEKFEEGVKLYRYCVQKLEEIEGKVLVIMNDQNGELQKLDLYTEGN